MTTIEFFQKLESTPRKWFLDGDRIRIPTIELDTKPTRQTVTCPSNAVCGCVGVTDVMVNGVQCGLGATFLDQIVYSADFKSGPYRDLLLKACGL